ncbi:Dabb family protein [Nocardia huaxiensis]|uniref:Dabb family protein n=1 Tax=Nocardia huaxiensis TaxID=2755382 RepID=A0A7D6VGX1_9NOCA|nr:Dabb family protein [Nocardia huaxiensis]
MARAAEAAAALAGVHHCSGGIDLPGSQGGSGAVVDLAADIAPAAALPALFAADADPAASGTFPAAASGAEVAGAEAIPLLPVASRIASCDSARRIKRTLLLTVRAGTPAAVVDRFEADLMAMPAHITAIKSWALSRVSGESRWTHVWEQEFESPEGLNGDYLLHPYHWTHVDRWFDPEVPGSIVEPAIAHLYRWADGPVLTE